jgi:hypothetical protein
MKIIGWLMISVLLFSILSFLGCAPEEHTYSLSLSFPMETNISNRCELVATATEDGTPVSGVTVRFEFAEDSCHNPKNLVGNESYDREVWVWAEEAPLMCEWEYLSPLISQYKPLATQYWKKEKVYSNSNNYVYCSTGPSGEPAKFAYTGIKSGTDTIVVSANVSGYELEYTATITWLPHVSPSSSWDLNGPEIHTTDMTGYEVLEMKIEIADAQLEGPWLLNIGNSPSNDGAGGDGGDFSNDSELDITGDGHNFTLQLYANEYFSTPGAVLANLSDLFPTATNTTAWILRVKIADQKMCVLNENTGASIDVTSQYIFRLGGPDAEAGQNDFIYYTAFNCVISGNPDRTGSGVTKVTYMWRSTWDNPSWEIP